ncbi:MAG: DEAD/DEAH box helicase [Paenibacillaceae bacterium]|nr:DEAD/DEAH box helicase [Paenibacillaceae bacterium]
MQFKDLKIMPDIIKALEKENYETPTPIQEKAIPVILEGGDLLGCAQTGTGKTAAFAIPTLQLLSRENAPRTSKQNIRALVITPTRELALQIHESFHTYGQFTNLKSCVVFGGVSQKPQEEELKQGVDILVATPGRLLALMDQKLINIEHLKILILDEADRMLDMGFINDVKKIIAKTPPKKQTLLFSATMPPDIARLAGTILKNPAEIKITPVSSTVDTINQYLYYTDKSNKKDLLLHILENKEIVSVLVFVRTKHGADRLIKQLARSNVSAQAIHGDKSQGARQRALSCFKDKTLRILLATDIAARGIDIDELTHVINFDLPDTPETYVHRIGRTGRAGLSGTAISFCDFDEKEQLKDIERLIGKKLTEVSDHPYPLKNNFPAIKTTQPKRDTGRTEKAKSHPSSQKSNATSKRESHQPVTGKKASATKKKYRMTADGTLKEKKSYNSFSTRRKSSK